MAILITTSAFTIVSQTLSWKVTDNAYSVKFTSEKFDGTFKGLKTELLFDENNLEAYKLTASIDANTINTGNGMRNEHAKKGLDSKIFQTVKYVSTSISETRGGHEAPGNLTIKDVTKSVTFPAKVTVNPGDVSAVAKFNVNRKDWGIVYPGMPDDLIQDLIWFGVSIKAEAPVAETALN